MHRITVTSQPVVFYTVVNDVLKELKSVLMRIVSTRKSACDPDARRAVSERQEGSHFRDRLKYRRSGGAWPFLAGMSKPSPLKK